MSDQKPEVVVCNVEDEPAAVPAAADPYVFAAWVCDRFASGTVGMIQAALAGAKTSGLMAMPSGISVTAPSLLGRPNASTADEITGPHVELWGLLCPDCGPEDEDAIAAAALAEIQRLRGNS